MNTWIVIMIAGLASMGIPVLSLGATEVSPTIGPPPIMDNVIIEETDESAVIKRIKECNVPKGARGFWAGADLSPNFSIGSSVQTQLIRYNITKGKASLNSQGIGGGITLRYYSNGWMAPTALKEDPGTHVTHINRDSESREARAEISERFSQDIVQRRGLLRRSRRI